MNDHQNALINNLTGVDSTIQKLLLIQLLAIIIYGLLFLDGLTIKRETDAFQSQLEGTNELLTSFAWLDSLASICNRYPSLSQQYQIALDKLQNRLRQLQRLESSSYYGNIVENTFRLDYPEWRRVRSQDLLDHVDILAERSTRIINQQIWLIQRLRRSPPIDSLKETITIRKYLEPIPALFDTLGPLVDKAYPEDAGSYKKFSTLFDSLYIQQYSQELPSLSSVENAVNKVSRFYQSNDIDSLDLSGLVEFRDALTDSIHAKENQKGELKLAFIEQPVSVKLAFNLALPILIFFNHLLLLSLGKKSQLHNELKQNMSSTMSIHLSPTFFNFLFTGNSIFLRIITWVFFFLLEVSVAVLGIVIFWYLLLFLPTSEGRLLITLIPTGIFLLIHEVQVISIFVRAANIKT